MGGCRLLAGGSGAGLKDHHRFFAASFGGGLDKLLAGADILQIGDDHLGFRVGGQSLKKIDLAEIGLVADADQFGQPQVAARRQIEDGGGQGAGLGDHRDLARRWHLGGKGGVHFLVAVDQPQAVGAQQPGLAGGAESGQPLFQGRPLLVHLLETGGDHRHRLGPGGQGIADRRLHQGAGHGDDCQLDLVAAALELGQRVQP